MPASGSGRLKIDLVEPGRAETGFAEDVRRGLLAEPKSLPPKYFYDKLGSHLFEAICLLPEYYLTAAELEILERRADEVVSSLDGPLRIVELGSGSSLKTRLLIEAALRRQTALDYLPIDISSGALEQSARALLQIYPPLRVRAFVSDYEGGLARLAAERNGGRNGAVRTLAVFLGSSIGNLGPDDAGALLRKVRRILGPGDGLLLGADLEKPEAELLAAYDDPLGITAAFNLNVLARINRELGGEFDLRRFGHRVRFDRPASRVELFAVSLESQTVAVRDLQLEVRFAEGETVHTESSYKYTRPLLERMARAGGFSLARRWLDPAARFSLNLLLPAAGGAPGPR